MEFILPNNTPAMAPTFGVPLSPLGQQLKGPLLNVPNRTPRPNLPLMPDLLRGMKRAISYNADYGGCGFWRMLWPDMLINMYQKGIVNSSTAMIMDPRYYMDTRCVRIQRQATPLQYSFVQYIRALSDRSETPFKIIYEIDDIIFREDIPEYNSSRQAFDNPIIAENSMNIIKICDEMTVTCEYMKQYYMDKTGIKNVRVIPNYAPKFWMDRFYSSQKVAERYDKNKKRPRIGYFGSGTHVDIRNAASQQDDFTHVVDVVKRTLKDFQWVFVGTVPVPLRPHVISGEIEYHKWTALNDYPTLIDIANVSATIAPLQDNIFNRSKSNIKYLEAAAHGLPCVCQDIVTYAMAPLRFKTGDEMIDQLKKLFADRQYYTKHSKAARQYAETMWLEDHLDEFVDMYNIKKD